MKQIKSIYRFLNPKYQNLFLEYNVNFRPRYGHGLPPHELLYSIIDKNRNQYKKLLSSFLEHTEFFHGIKKSNEEKDINNPTWNNGFLPGLDIINIYSIVSKYRPKKYIEVGSGNSTKVAYKAIRENKLNTEIISIDPCPRAEIDNLSNKVIRQPFECIDFNFIFDLKENDILFIDNSHRALPNSDATVFFLEVLPKLSKGVIVHIHDIYLPYDYPQFMCDRFYSEQYLLASYLLANSKKYNPLLPNYFISEDKELKKILEPIWNHPNLEGVKKHGGSFWLKID